MATRRQVLGALIWIITIFLVFVLFSIGNTSGKERTFKNEIEFSTTNTFIPPGWTGIPLSIDNNLYVDPMLDVIENQKKRAELKEELLAMNVIDFISGSAHWDQMVADAFPVIGWNGIFDVYEEVIKIVPAPVTKRNHALGEMMAKYARTPRHAVEISSRNIISKAPLHGSVWYFIEQGNFENEVDLFAFVDTELCFFKHEKDMGNIWISCAHGVGHGLANRFGLSEIDQALAICAANKDPQFQYSCATGVYMSFQGQSMQFSPCDTNRFPGACFRFKMTFSGIPDICTTQSDPYHTLGCIWGISYVNGMANHEQPADVSVCDIYKKEADDPYHLACLDGSLSPRYFDEVVDKAELLSRICGPLEDLPEAFALCQIRTQQSFQHFTFTDDSIYFYNVDVLEAFYNPSIIAKPAEWKQEWANPAIHDGATGHHHEE